MNLNNKVNTNDLIVKYLKKGESILVNAEASDILHSLQDNSGIARLVLIDPPYNRRTRFHHYNDSTNREKWLSTIKTHCSILRKLLTLDGSLWMHIDDAEMARVRETLDSVFGSSNFVATIVWQKTVSRDNRTPISTSHEYLLVYAKNKGEWHRFRHKLLATEEQIRRYKNPDDDPRGPWTSGDLTAKAGPGRRAAQFYELKIPSGRLVTPATGTAWRYTRDRLQELIDDNRIDFGNGDKMPRLKRFLSEVESGLVPDTWWSGNDVGTADTAKRHLKLLFPNLIPFETPKPEELTARVLHIATNPGDLVIDIYGGSGTTAAVAHKMSRKWLTVEKESRTFCEFTLPRLKLVTKGLDPGGITDKFNWTGGGQFKVLGGE